MINKPPYVHTHEGVLLVGSIPLSSTEEVFTKVCSALPDSLYAIPDGETGERCQFVAWQLTRFPVEARRPELFGEPFPSSGIPAYTVEDIQPTGYDDAALESYAKFVEMRKRGIIPSNTLFQICLPTPYNAVQLAKVEAQAQLEPLYEKRMEESIRRIVDTIPHDDMVIQWDLAFDTLTLEYEKGRLPDRFKPWFEPIREGLIERVARASKVIPPDVKVAFHFCYGDYNHQHFVEPVDTELMVGFANGVLAAMEETHHIDYIHLPVPRNRTDAAYFEPLNKLRLNGAGLYLGLVHANDEEGTNARFETAKATCPYPFGVATECGMGRTPREELDSILAISKAVTTVCDY